MPYPWFTKVTRDDVMAIKAYLFSLPPVHNVPPPNHLSFPFNVHAGLAVWNTMFLRPGEFKPDPSKSAEFNRGAYIVEGLRHCGECHNGRNMLGDTSMAESLRGSRIQDLYAPNITFDVHDGIGKYIDHQLFSFLKAGVAGGMAVVAGPVAETVHGSLSQLTDGDIRAIVAYVKSPPAKASYTDLKRTAYSGPQPAGRRTYLSNCASCHQLDGKGVKDSVSSLVGNGAVLAKGPEDMIRVVHGGIEAQGTYAPMPAVAAGLSDQQVADVVNYVRQPWGNQAPPNAGAGNVGDLRAKTFAVMNRRPNGSCHTGMPADIASAIGNAKSGIINELKAMTLETVLQTAQTVVAKVKETAPHAKPADTVNGLTLAYCPIVRDDSHVPAAQKVTQLDKFSECVYSELQRGGEE